jgi:hypothetical protein
MGIENEPIIRSNIQPLARSMRDGGIVFPSEIRDPYKQVCGKRSAQAYEIWNNGKVERNALLAVLIDDVVDRAIADKPLHPPYGLMTEKKGETVENFDPNKDSYVQLTLYIAGTLEEALELEMIDWEKAIEEDTHQENHKPVVSAYWRLAEIIDWRQKYIERKGETDLQLFIENGMGTAANHMVAFLRLIPKVFQQENPDKAPVPPELAELLRNSYYLIADLAAQHMYTFGEQEDILCDKHLFDTLRYNPNDFIIHQTPHGPRLALKDTVLQKIKSVPDQIPFLVDESRVATGCPALVNFGGSSAVRKMWDWNVELAEKLYPKLDSMVQSSHPWSKDWA